MKRDYWLLALLALIFFFPFLGGVHLFDWDEINFAECAREMIATGDYFRPHIDFEPFWEKPPLFIWMQALSMHLWGVGEYAARFPNAVCGLLTLMVVYHIGTYLFDRKFGLIWALAWIGSILPHLYFRSGIIDPWFNLLIFCGLFGFIRFRWTLFQLQKDASFWLRYRFMIVGGLFLGMAILTKGPTAYLIAILTIVLYWAKYKFKGHGYFRHLLLFSLAAASVSLIWFAADIALHGPWFVKEFITYQVRLFSTPDSGHGGFFGYHFVVLLVGCFPVSVFAIANLWGDRQPEEELMEEHTMKSCLRCDFISWMQILFWVVLILFSIVSTKIVHYSSMCYFPLTFLGSVTIWRAMRYQQKARIVPILLPILGVLIGVVVAAVPYVGQHIDLIKPLFQKDPFALALLDAHVDWQLMDSAPGILLIIISIVGAYFWQKDQIWRSAEMLFVGSGLFVAFTLMFFIRNIEAYSQRAAIEFYETKSVEDCYIKTIGFKSFANLFYAKKQPVGQDKSVDDYVNIAHGNPGKPVYFVCKITDLGELPNLPDCKELYRKNGFVFFERKVVPQK